MEIDANKLIADALRDGIREGLKQTLTRSYNNPMDAFITKVLTENEKTFRGMIEEAISSCRNDEDFRKSIIDGTRHTLAKTLIARFGGELEKQVTWPGLRLAERRRFEGSRSRPKSRAVQDRCNGQT